VCGLASRASDGDAAGKRLLRWGRENSEDRSSSGWVWLNARPSVADLTGAVALWRGSRPPPRWGWVRGDRFVLRCVGLGTVQPTDDVHSTARPASTTTPKEGLDGSPSPFWPRPAAPGAPTSETLPLDRLVERLSVVLQDQADLVRELSAARAELLARHREAEVARQQSEHMLAGLSTFLHAFGHDLRAPLIGIDATAQLLESACDELAPDALVARAAQDAKSIRHSCHFGLTMIGDLFELLRADAGKWEIAPSDFDALDAVEEVVEIFKPQAARKGILLELLLDHTSIGAPLSVQTDANRLRQALANVIGNAVKFSNAGSVCVEIAHLCHERIEVRVRDSGPGLEDGALQHLFEPFHQCSRTAAHAGEGLGLGLAIAQRAAHAIGGAWRAENRADARGALFTLRFPRNIPNEARPAAGQGDAA
jgi:signal transduction histidine kinase